MSLETDDNSQLKPKDLVVVLAIAGRLDAQSRLLAEKIDKDRTVYYGYAALDSLSSSYSMFKYFLDIFMSNNDPDSMHDLMLTPGGIAAITLESLFLVSFSVLSVLFDEKKKGSFQKAIADAWPFFRDVIKGLKNAYKGWRSAVSALKLVFGIDIKFLIAPLGLALGILAAINRFLLRNMIEKRKDMMCNNTDLRKEIQQLDALDEEGRRRYQEECIQYQSKKTRVLSLIAVCFGGFIDGLYLYVGVLGLAALSTGMIIPMVAICIFYTLACMIVRAYEEYDYQNKLYITQTKCELELIAKVMETSYKKLLMLQEKRFKSDMECLAIYYLKMEMTHLLGEFDMYRSLLKKQTNNTYWSVCLLGLKNGLYAYGAFASALFFVAMIFSLAGTPLSPILLVASIASGLVFIASFMIYSLVKYHMHMKKQEKPQNSAYDQLFQMKDMLVDMDELPEVGVFQYAVHDGLAVEPTPQPYFQESFEVVRSFFSGVVKGQKFVDFAGNPLQEQDAKGHYHDTPLMNVLSGFSGLLFGSFLSLRAFAKGFKTQLGQDQTKDQTKPPHQMSKSQNQDHTMSSKKNFWKAVHIELNEKRKSLKDKSSKIDTLSRTYSQAGYARFYPETPKAPRHSEINAVEHNALIHRSGSVSSLHKPPISRNTIQDLAWDRCTS